MQTMVDHQMPRGVMSSRDFVLLQNGHPVEWVRVSNNVAPNADGNMVYVNVALSIDLFGIIVHAPHQHLVLLFT